MISHTKFNNYEALKDENPPLYPQFSRQVIEEPDEGKLSSP